MDKAMGNYVVKRAVIGREDISRFVVHLTRDDRQTFTNGGTARENFQAIIKERRIGAFRPHCLYGDRIPEPLRGRFSVCCFSEVPLTQIHCLVGEIPKRQVKLEPYGLVFSREFILSEGAQPAIYVNSYSGNIWLREAADRLFEVAEKDRLRKGKLWRFLPLINAMHERYDFTWEREWRIRGDLRFSPKDVVCIILPRGEEKGLQVRFAKSGIPVISPRWSYEEIVGEFSKQQKHTRRIWIEKWAEQRNSEKLRSKAPVSREGKGKGTLTFLRKLERRWSFHANHSMASGRWFSVRVIIGNPPLGSDLGKILIPQSNFPIACTGSPSARH